MGSSENDEVKRLKAQVILMQGELSEAFERARAADKRASEADKRASEADKRASEADDKTREADKRASEAYDKAREADKRARVSDEKASKATGEYFVNMSQLKFCRVNLRDNESFWQSHQEIAIRMCTFFSDHIPPANASDCGEGSRLQPSALHFDLFGNTSASEKAHLIPFAEQCRQHWTPVVRLLTNQASKSDLDKILNGWRLPNSDRRERHSGFVHAVWNFVRIGNQDKHLDGSPAVMFVPLVDFKSGWQGDGYKVLIIARNSLVFREIGACENTMVTMPSTDSLKQYFEGFVEIARLLVECMLYRRALDNFYPDSEKKVCRSLANHILDTKYIDLPMMNDALEGNFRVAEFGPALNPKPGSVVASEESDGKHPAPHPVLLVCKSLNAWFTELSKRRSDDNTFLAPMTQNLSQSDVSYCLFPSCTPSKPLDCLLCRSIFLLKHASCTSEERDLLHSVVDGNEMVSEDTFKSVVLKLQDQFDELYYPDLFCQRDIDLSVKPSKLPNNLANEIPSDSCAISVDEISYGIEYIQS